MDILSVVVCRTHTQGRELALDLSLVTRIEPMSGTFTKRYANSRLLTHSYLSLVTMHAFWGERVKHNFVAYSLMPFGEKQ